MKSNNRQPTKHPNPPSVVEYKNLKFIIFDAPSDANVDLYIKELLDHKVTEIVRVCEPTYDKSAMENVGIKVYDWPFADGEAPPNQIVHDWLALVQKKFDKRSHEITPIGVHCVAGLGRAPVLVAMALIEAGMAPLDSVIYIRERRRGAINARQLKYLEAYKKRSREKSCIIS